MAIKAKDSVPIHQVKSRFTELAEEARQGREKIITKNGESYVALIDARRLDYYHRLEKERIHIALRNEAIAGLEDAKAGRAHEVAEFKSKYLVKAGAKTRAKKNNG